MTDDDREERRTEKAVDKLRKALGYLVPVAGGLIAIWVIYLVIVSGVKPLPEQIQDMRLEIQELRLQIRDLQEKINSLETRLPNKSNIQFRFGQKAIDGSESKVVNASESLKKNNVVIREYIVPAIYFILALLLLASAFVTLGAHEQSRKDSAMEITKTLMTFFIGAATGQA